MQPIEPSGRAHPERLAVRVPEHVVYRDFAEQTVALNLHTGRYHGLNETSAEMLEALREAPTVAAAARAARAVVGRRSRRAARRPARAVRGPREPGPDRDPCRRVTSRRARQVATLRDRALVAEVLVTYALVRWSVRRHDLPSAVAALRAPPRRRHAPAGRWTPTSAAWPRPPCASSSGSPATRAASRDRSSSSRCSPAAASTCGSCSPPGRRRRSRLTPGSSAAGVPCCRRASFDDARLAEL